MTTRNARIMFKNVKEKTKRRKPTISVDAARQLRCCCAYLVMLVLAREECVAVPGDVRPIENTE